MILINSEMFELQCSGRVLGRRSPSLCEHRDLREAQEAALQLCKTLCVWMIACGFRGQRKDVVLSFCVGSGGEIRGLLEADSSPQLLTPVLSCLYGAELSHSPQGPPLSSNMVQL